MKTANVFWLTAVLLLAVFSAPSAQESSRTPEQQALEARLDELARGRGERARIAAAMKAFYAARGFEPFWLNGGSANRRADALLARLAAADQHGLEPDWYIDSRLARQVAAGPVDEVPRVEIALTRALLRYAREVRAGHVRVPRQIRGTANQPEPPEPETILGALASASDIDLLFDKLPPQTRRYRRLTDALARYRKFAEKGAWPRIGEGETIKPGMTDPRVPLVRARLQRTGDLKVSQAGAPTDYDAALVAAVRRFQDRMGLTVDGAIGRDTVQALNVPVETRINEIIINLERRRWRVGLLEKRYIWVNAAAQEAKLVENDRTVFETRVIVGTRHLQTPEFSARATFVQLNPYWNVPRSIATKEMLPRIKKDPGYLTRNHYLLLRVPGNNATAVNPHNVDWSEVNGSNFPFAIRQTPGRWNALGRVILRFPNRFNVYMHDTPSCELFEREVRTFSHGCIRTENPHRLVSLILQRQSSEWTEERLLELTTGETGPTRQIDIEDPFWVHITYITAWADADGTVQFRRDFYGRDPALLRAMALP